jgi:lipopolysaccharide/colanic/teichoic acid biosynthesis glycosyltransferase
VNRLARSRVPRWNTYSWWNGLRWSNSDHLTRLQAEAETQPSAQTRAAIPPVRGSYTLSRHWISRQQSYGNGNGKRGPGSISKNNWPVVLSVQSCVFSRDDPQGLDEKTLGRIVGRYARIDSFSRWWRATARLKQLSWICALRCGGALKRLLDVTGAAILLTLLSPVLLIFAGAVKVTSRGPVFFKQKRVGARGHVFHMYKFRSMYRDAETRLQELLPYNEVTGGVIFKIKNDPRITPVGAFMRQWSIDELPQLWNVLKGDMSLVGPRPPLPAEVQLYTLTQRRRLDAVPGLTCIWQVSGRCEIPFEQQVEFDVDYIESQSLLLDLKLLLRTVPAVLQRRGAY